MDTGVHMRRMSTPAIRQVNNSRDDTDSVISSVEFASYTVHIPPTPEYQPLYTSIETSNAEKVEDLYASNSLFTGGYNRATRSFLKEKMTDSVSSHPQMAGGANGSTCSIPGCDAKIMRDERGEDIVPCDCDFKICRDCFRDAVRGGDVVCLGCKEPYKGLDIAEPEMNDGRRVSSGGMSRRERRMSMIKSRMSLKRSEMDDFDHKNWLFETKGSYGYGNAMWPKEDVDGDYDGFGNPQVLYDKKWRPLTRKLNISTTILSPYRFILLHRCEALFCASVLYEYSMLLWLRWFLLELSIALSQCAAQVFCSFES